MWDDDKEIDYLACDEAFQHAMLRAAAVGTGSEREIRRHVVKDDRPIRVTAERFVPQSIRSGIGSPGAMCAEDRMAEESVPTTTAYVQTPSSMRGVARRA
jgi:hypothetical protein